MYTKCILSKCIRARIDIKHDRVSVLEFNTVDEKILMISAYMPYFNTDGNTEQLIEYQNTIAFIENVLLANPLHKYILFMDLNCNLFNPTHPYSSLMINFINNYDLVNGFSFCPGFDPAQEFTRFDIKRKSYTLIDGILISKSLSHIIENCQIVHPPNNVSDHLPVELTVKLEIRDFLKEESVVSNFIPWSTLSVDELSSFRNTMSDALADISIPYIALNHNSELCDDCDCLILLEKLHNDIVSAVARADQCLPRRKHGISKPYWSPELTELKQKSFDAHQLWRNCNRPRTGPIFLEKQRTNYEYKLQLRKSKSVTRSNLSSQLSENLLTKDTDSFWKSWNQLNGNSRSFSTMIDGFVDYNDITNRFANVFKDIYKGSEANDKLRSQFDQKFPPYEAEYSHDSLKPFLFTWSDMLDAVFKLKLGKATSTFIKAEHIFHGCPELLCYLHLLFNALLSHSYMPYEFLCGTITPIIKDPNGDSTNSNNYRGITLGPIFLQIFEYLLLNKFGHFLETDDLQFGYKGAQSTSHAIYVLKECVNYYTTHGSNVLVSFLDCSKAFDTVSHFGIFLRLIEQGVPLCFLKLLIYWYSNMQTRCLWRHAFSEYFSVPTGTKQGGVLSPRIFSLYMDRLIRLLRNRGIGCHIIGLFLACLLYADDLCLLAPSRGAMQEMLSICELFCDEFCLSFNVKKSKSLIFGNTKSKTFAPLTLKNESMEYVSQWTYLGATVVAGTTLSFTCKRELGNFYRSFNSLLSTVQKPNELVLMNLLYTNCVPSLTNAAEVKDISSSEMHKCNVALNDAIRRIFSYNRWESTRALRQELGFHNITEIFHSRRETFISKCLKPGNRNKVVFALASFLNRDR